MIWLIAGMLSPGCVMFIMTFLDINRIDPVLSDSRYYAEYHVEGRFETDPGGGQADRILLNVERRDEGLPVLDISGYGDTPAQELNDDGGVGPGLYSLFWIHLDNPISMFGTQEKMWKYRVRDEAGFIGAPGAEYTARSIESFIYWDYILSSQASYRVGIYDGDRRVATAVYDMTCGMLFELVPNVGGWGRLYLVSTDFPISRNRYNMMYTVAVFCVVIMAWFILQYTRAAPARKYKAIDHVWYAAAICGTVAVDFLYDSWFFANGDIVTAALHLGVIAILALRFRLWVIPMVLELAWVIAYTLPTTGQLVPGIVYNPSMLGTVALMIIFRKTPKPRAAEK